MPVEFQILSLRTQIQEDLPEKQSEQLQLQQLLEIGEDKVLPITVLEHEQRWHKMFIDRHRGGNKNFFEIGKAVLVFQTRMGKM